MGGTYHSYSTFYVSRSNTASFCKAKKSHNSRLWKCDDLRIDRDKGCAAIEIQDLYSGYFLGQGHVR